MISLKLLVYKYILKWLSNIEKIDALSKEVSLIFLFYGDDFDLYSHIMNHAEQNVT